MKKMIVFLKAKGSKGDEVGNISLNRLWVVTWLLDLFVIALLLQKRRQHKAVNVVLRPVVMHAGLEESISWRSWRFNRTEMLYDKWPSKIPSTCLFFLLSSTLISGHTWVTPCNSCCNDGQTIINHLSGNGLYQLFMLCQIFSPDPMGCTQWLVDHCFNHMNHPFLIH